MKRVFSLNKFMAEKQLYSKEPIVDEEQIPRWARDCDGLEVDNDNMVKMFSVHPNWIAYIPEEGDSVSIDIKTFDNKWVMVYLTINGKRKSYAFARCHPDDKFDYATGVRIAMDRLFGGKYNSPIEL